MENNFDLVVIGGGPGGYVCALDDSTRIKNSVRRVRGALGGTCLNVGCIPSKSLLNLSENFHKAKKILINKA